MAEVQTITPAVAVAPPPAAAVAVAPVPLTAAPAEAAAPVERVKRKYTKRAVKADAPVKAKRKYTKRAVKAAAPKKAKVAKAPKEKKAKRVAGTKAQGQVAKGVMRFLKAAAKEQDTTVGVLVGTGVTKYAKSLGFDPEA